MRECGAYPGRGAVSTLTSAQSGKKKNLADAFDWVEHARGSHLAINRDGDRGFEVISFDQLLADAGELALEICDYLTDITTLGRNFFLAAG